MNELALFAGAGGGILGGKLLGWRTICAVEWEAYPASVLISRQNEGILPPFPVWNDVQTFDGKPWRGRVDVVSGGFPCQDISSAGKGAGIDGERSSMWGHMARIIGEVLPKQVYVENSPMLVGRGLTRVLSDLASMGYDARWCVLGARDAGAPHQRDRIWIVANHSMRERLEGAHDNGAIPERIQPEPVQRCEEMADADLPRRGQSHKKMEGETPKQFDGGSVQSREISDPDSQRLSQLHNATEPDDEGQSPWGFTQKGREAEWWTSEPDVGRVAHGVAARVDRLKAIGNGQVPQVAALAWNILNDDI